MRGHELIVKITRNISYQHVYSDIARPREKAFRIRQGDMVFARQNLRKWRLRL